MATIRLSKSSINTYNQCPEKFKFITILKYADPAGPEAQIGIKLHGIFNEFYDNIDDPAALTEQKIYDLAMQYDNGSYTNHLESFATFNIMRFRDLKDKALFKPILAEKKLYNEKLNISGLIDALFKDDNGDITILDYKTGAYRSDHLLDYRDELSVYNELARLETKHVPTHWGIKFTKNGYLWREPVVKSHFESVIVPRIQQIQESEINNHFPPKTGPLCLYCAQKKYCSAFGKYKEF